MENLYGNYPPETMKTKIEWADITINPIVGCSHCSPGCDNCYAERFAARLARNPQTAAKYRGVVDERGRWTGKINLHMDGCLHAATVTRKPKRFFIGSMTDIFHENIPDEEIRNLFLSIAIVPNHLPTYMVLTKRPQRAQAILGDMLVSMPELHRVWLGVTVCNQQEADEKIPILLQTPASKRFVSIEPMLGPVNIEKFLRGSYECGLSCGKRMSFRDSPEMRCTKCGFVGPDDATWGDGDCAVCPECGQDGCCGAIEAICPDCGHYMVRDHPATPYIDWVICGGETGPGARPMHPEWARSLRDQCQAAGVPFFFKGWGEWVTENQSPEDIVLPGHSTIPYGWKGRKYEDSVYRVGKSRSGRLLDGREWNEVPDEN